MNKIVEIKLTRGKVAQIDTNDLDLVSGYAWCYMTNGYAATSVGGRKDKRVIYMHRLLMGVTQRSLDVDHINHDKLDNRRQNLRVCSHKNNGSNMVILRKGKKTSTFKGVYFDKSRGKWTARIKVDYKGIFLGRFIDEREAAQAYNEAATKFFGEFSRLNTL